MTLPAGVGAFLEFVVSLRDNAIANSHLLTDSARLRLDPRIAEAIVGDVELLVGFQHGGEACLVEGVVRACFFTDLLFEGSDFQSGAVGVAVQVLLLEERLKLLLRRAVDHVRDPCRRGVTPAEMGSGLNDRIAGQPENQKDDEVLDKRRGRLAGSSGHDILQKEGCEVRQIRKEQLSTHIVAYNTCLVKLLRSQVCMACKNASMLAFLVSVAVRSTYCLKTLIRILLSSITQMAFGLLT